MAEVKPFRGIHYDVKRVGDLTRVVAPPYDVISPEEQEALHRRHPKNITWVDFGMAKEGDGPGVNKYTRAAAWFREWLAEGTLVRDAVPSLYYYEQEFTIPGKRTFVRKGFLGALKLSAFGEGEVFPHERTLSKPKEDRLALMRVTDVHMSPIFALYSDPKDEVLSSLRSAMAAAPDMAAVDDLGVKHRVWTVSAAQGAPGSGRRDEGEGGLHRRRAPPVRDGAGVPRRDAEEARREPRRRVRARAHVPVQHGRRGDRHPADAPRDPLRARLLGGRASSRRCAPTFRSRAGTARRRTRCAPWRRRGGREGDRVERGREPVPRGRSSRICPAFCDKFLSKFPPQLRPLDVVLLHGFILEQLLGISPEAVTAGQCVKYYKDPSKATADLASGAIQAAFFMNAVTIPEFRDVSLSGHVLPQKSTFFYPKIGTGLLIFPVSGDDRVPG